MNSKFVKRLESYLDSECSDFGLTYKWEWNEDIECCEVKIKRDDDSQNTKYLYFKYDEDNDNLKIELSEDSYYTTREFDWTVKYFWMLVCPSLFPES